MYENFFTSLFLSLMLGALIGIQREIRLQKENKKDLAGFRTFTFISLYGFLSGYLSIEILKNTNFLLLSFSSIILLMITSYYIVSKDKNGDISIITQVLILFAYVIGLLISLNYYYISIILSVTIAVILFLSNQLHLFAKRLTKSEVFATLKFIIVSIVILPILPNKNYTLLELPWIGNILLEQNLFSTELISQLDVFNFYHVWLMVVFVSGIAYIGYVLMKVFGSKKGILITGLLGGFMSSTALTTSFSIQSKKESTLTTPLAIGVIIACSVMFFRVLFEVLVLNPELFFNILIPMTLMGLTGIGLAIYLLIKSRNKGEKIHEHKIHSPFTLKPAFTFAAIFLIVSLLSKLFSILFGNSGVYLLSFISGITDVDAIVISLCGLSKQGILSNSVTSFGIIIASISNTFFKAGIAYYFGSKDFFKVIMYVFGVILFVCGLSFLI